MSDRACRALLAADAGDSLVGGSAAETADHQNEIRFLGTVVPPSVDPLSLPCWGPWSQLSSRDGLGQHVQLLVSRAFMLLTFSPPEGVTQRTPHSCSCHPQPLPVYVHNPTCLCQDVLPKPTSVNCTFKNILIYLSIYLFQDYLYLL